MRTRLAYHVTPTRNVPSIRKRGLVTGLGGFSLDKVHLSYSRKTAERYGRDLAGRGESNLSIITVRVPYGLQLIRHGFVPPFAVVESVPPESIIKVERFKV